jgi:hypothetical protein
VLTTYWPEDEKEKPVIIDGRVLHDDESAVATWMPWQKASAKSLAGESSLSNGLLTQ